MTGTCPGDGVPEGYDQLNHYSRVIVDEALRRSIHVEVLEPSLGELALSRDGRRVTTLESLSDLTTAVAFRRCDHKLQTRRVLQAAGLRVPEGKAATFDEDDFAFLREWKDIVVKPARGEGGEGVAVGVVDRAGLEAALDTARALCPDVLLEQRCEGEDLRVVVIGGEVVAAAVRTAPTVTGDGRHTVGQLVETLSRARSAETGGASCIPLDATTRSVVAAAGFDLDDIAPEGAVVRVRRTANLHTGGTIRDVTDDLHPDLADVSRQAADAIGIPVVGLDLVVPAVDEPDYTIIEANEQPGLANHEPRPTVERFLELLFPVSPPSGPKAFAGRNGEAPA